MRLYNTIGIEYTYNIHKQVNNKVGACIRLQKPSGTN